MTNFEKLKEDLTKEQVVNVVSDEFSCSMCPARVHCDSVEGNCENCELILTEWLDMKVDDGNR